MRLRKKKNCDRQRLVSDDVELRLRDKELLQAEVVSDDVKLRL